MNLAQLTSELHEHIRDDYIRDHYVTDWVNDAVLGLASEFLLPALRLITPHSLTVTSANWLYDLPDSFHKEVFKAQTDAYSPVYILPDVHNIDDIDPDHDETDLAVTYIAVDAEQRKLAIYPKPESGAGLRLWFYRRPEVLANPNDSLTCIPEQYQRRVVIPKVILNAYPLLMDMAVQPPITSLGYWQQKYQEGLFGTPLGDVGMVRYLATQRPPRVSLDPHRPR